LSVEQNVLLRWVPESALPELYRFLSAEGLGTCCAGQIMDVTHCVGSTCCLSAITNSMAAARALEGLFTNGLGRHPRLRNLRIRVSGCTNSCSHHYAADIGLFGISKRAQDRPAPHYALLLGGQADGERLGRRMAEIPASRLAPAVERLLRSFLENSPPAQSFSDWAAAAGEQRIRSLLDDLLRIPSPEEDPAFYRDLEETTPFSVQAKEGECSA